jgi:hypothetical protein
VHEDILAAALRLDEAVAFGRVEPFHSACSHNHSPGFRCSADNERRPDIS